MKAVACLVLSAILILCAYPGINAPHGPDALGARIWVAIGVVVGLIGLHFIWPMREQKPLGVIAWFVVIVGAFFVIINFLSI
jgi:hypothetical protein